MGLYHAPPFQPDTAEPRPTAYGYGLMNASDKKLGRVLHLRELPRPHAGSAEIADLARAHQIVQCLHRFLDRRGRVKPMDLIQIDEVRTQPPEAAIDSGKDSLARQAARVRPLDRLRRGIVRALERDIDRMEQLGRDDDFVARRHPLGS